MYQLKAKAAFDSAHFLSGYKGKCANLHGHRWTIEVIVEQGDLVEPMVAAGFWGLEKSPAGIGRFL